MRVSEKVSFRISFSCNNHSMLLLSCMLLHGPTTDRQVSSDLGWMTTLLLSWYSHSSSSPTGSLCRGIHQQVCQWNACLNAYGAYF
jgi:hypothetical protein